jgi:hypothetical protein
MKTKVQISLTIISPNFVLTPYRLHAALDSTGLGAGAVTTALAATTGLGAAGATAALAATGAACLGAVFAGSSVTTLLSVKETMR